MQTPTIQRNDGGGGGDVLDKNVKRGPEMHDKRCAISRLEDTMPSNTKINWLEQEVAYKKDRNTVLLMV